MEKATFSESHAWNFSVQSPNWKTYADHCTACINIPSRLYETVISTVDLYGTVGKYGGKYSWKEPVKFSLNLSFFSLHSFFARWLGVSRSGVFVGEATTRLMQVQRRRRQQRGLVQRETEREWNRAKAKARERERKNSGKSNRRRRRRRLLAPRSVRFACIWVSSSSVALKAAIC